MLCNCVQTATALFGPALTVGKTGNVYQAGLSYASGDVIKNKLGKTPTQYIKEKVFNKSKKNKLDQIHIKNKGSVDKEIILMSTSNEEEYNSFIIALKKTLK